MSHSRGRQEVRNNLWQQRQREGSREKNRNRLERHPQGEHSGQNYDRETENRWENDPGQGYAYPRQSNSESHNYDEDDSRYDLRPRPESWRVPRDFNQANSNREWVTGTGQPPYRGDRPGRYSQDSDSYAGSPMDFQGRHEPSSNSWFRSREYRSASRSSPAIESTSQEYRKSPGARQSFAGRGPQGYTRSDERITEDINEEMTQDHDLDAYDISVETRNGEVILKGTVSDRESKRRAEEIAESCSGVKDVQNQIRIKRENSSNSGHDSADDKSDGKRSTKLAN